MFSLSRILLPTDFSEACRGAKSYGEILAKHFHSGLTLLHVIETPNYELGGLERLGPGFDDLSAREANLRTLLNELIRHQLAGTSARGAVRCGDPAREIVDYARAEKVDLIIMPTHGYGLFRQFLLGSVTAKVLHDAACPVWTGVHLQDAPALEPLNFSSILCAVDLGQQSRKTLCWAAQLAAEFHARLTVAHVTHSLGRRLGEEFDPGWQRHLAEIATGQIDELQRSLGTQAEVVIGHGDTSQAVCSAAQAVDADLLVIGRGAASGIFGRLRTHAYSIIRQSPSPVVSV